MSRQSASATPAPPGRLAVILTLFFAFQCALLLAPGTLVISNMEGDVMHLLDGAARVAAGQRPHVDFHTPLGALNFHLVADWGAPPGRALALANIAVMAALLPALIWTGASRFSLPAAAFVGIAALVMAGCFAWMPEAPGATAAMSYNRWGWAAAFAALPIMLLPPRRGSARAADRADGLAIGLIGGTLVFVKITYAAALAPLWLVWALAAGRSRAALISLAAGLSAMAACTAYVGGVEVAAGYLSDLLTVARSETRPEPGLGLLALPAHPANAVVTLGALAGVMSLLRGGLGREAALFALAAAGVYAIAWQNYGNHPTGALVLPLALLALVPRMPEAARSFGASARRVMNVAAIAMLAVTAPPVIAMERSLAAPWAQAQDEAVHLPRMAADIRWEVDEGGPQMRVPAGDRGPAAVTFAGVDLPGCRNLQGWSRVFADAIEALETDPALRGRSVAAAEVVDALWLAAGAPPREGVQIWAYDGSGRALSETELLAVPRCPLGTDLRDAILEEAEALPFRSLRETRHWVFFENLGAGAGGPQAMRPEARSAK
jgi:hypothetical protein